MSPETPSAEPPPSPPPRVWFADLTGRDLFARAQGPGGLPEALERLGAETALAAPGTPAAEIPAAAGWPPPQLCVIFYDRAERAVIAALEAGGTAAAGLAEWQESAAALLALHRGMRRHLLLAEAAGAARDPGALLARLCTRLGLEAPGDAALAPGAEEGPDPVQAALAGQLAAAHPEAGRLQAALDAVSLPAAEPGAGADAALRFHAAQMRRLDSAAAEMDLMLLQLCGLQSELESQFRQGRGLEARAAELEAARAAAVQAGEAAAAEHARQLAAAQEEQALMLLQLCGLQDELETALGRETALAARLRESEGALKEARAAQEAAAGAAAGRLAQAEEAAAARIAALEAELAGRTGELRRSGGQLREAEAALARREAELRAFHASTSWRVTGPLRRVKTGLAGLKNRQDRDGA